MTFLRTAIPLYPFDLSMIYFGKPVSTFPDHAPGGLPVALMPVADALAAILAGAEPLPEEMIALDDAWHRVLARDVAARRTQPPQAMSAMDGYAVRAADAADLAARLKVIGEVAAGRPVWKTVGGNAAGAAFPVGGVPHGAVAHLLP